MKPDAVMVPAKVACAMQKVVVVELRDSLTIGLDSTCSAADANEAWNRTYPPVAGSAADVVLIPAAITVDVLLGV